MRTTLPANFSYVKGARANTPLAEVMTRAVGTLVDGKVTITLNDAKILAVSLYYSHLPAPGAIATVAPGTPGRDP